VVAPQVPGGGSVRQAIFNDEAHSHVNDPMRVVTARRGEFRNIGAEVQAAGAAAVAGVGQVQIAWPILEPASQVVQDPVANVVAVTTPPAARAGASAIVRRFSRKSNFSLLHSISMRGRRQFLGFCQQLNSET
jgi:hypothetical protein